LIVATDEGDLAGHVAEFGLTGGDGGRGLTGTVEELGRTGAVVVRGNCSLETEQFVID
jgi:hypothetical protein